MNTSRLHSCNVLSVGAVDSQLWQFDVDDGEVQLTTERAVSVSAPLPGRLVAKDWRTLWQRTLNLAWLPPDQVFVRVVHLPTQDRAEVFPMLELQMEKLSPFPINQIVWSFELLPALKDNQCTAIVVIITRNLVEEFLGQLEHQGYLADRLELPFLHELLATEIDGDGAWIYPSPMGGKNYCLVAWWYGGTLQNVNLLHLPAENWSHALVDELTKIAWAGEIEGWLTAPPRFRLVADTATAAVWEPAVQELTGAPVAVVQSMPAPELAALNAQRVARAETQVNLLPVEFAARYKQQFIDRLWMRFLGAAGIVYLVGVLIYFGVLQWVDLQNHNTAKRAAAVSGSYTNALQIQARIQILQDQVNLKYAALDCWKATIETLPTELSLTSMSFQGGQTLRLTGLAPGDQDSKVTDYTEALGKVIANESPLFGKVTVSSRKAAGVLGPQTIYWSIECKLQRPEI